MIRCLGLLIVGSMLLPAQTIPPAPAAPAEEVLRIPEPGRFKELFRPFRTDNAAISPDGRYLAYSVRDGEKLSVIVVEINHPEKLTAHVQVADDEGATPMLDMTQTERNPARINWLGWTTPTRVVVETNRVLPQNNVAGNWLNWRGAVLAFDADGGNARVLMTPKDADEFTSVAVDAPPKAAMLPSLTGRPDDRRMGRTAPASQPVGNSLLGTFAAEGQAGGQAGAPPEAPDLPQPDERLTATVLDGSPQVRTLRILDHDPSRPGAVNVVVTSPETLALYSLDTMSGKAKPVSDEHVAESLDRMLDRQGRLRLTLPNSLRYPFPLHYEYLGPKGTSRPRPLEEVTGLTGFSVSPANYFGARAIPLGFDDDPAILYYAANTGRDTFGVYSINLATKQRGRLALENPDYDLVAPADSGFPDRSVLVFDRFKHQLAGVRFDGALATTAWTRPDWQEMQAGFERTFPGRSVRIVDWDRDGRRFVVSTEGPADPGAFFIYDGEKRQLLEFVRRAPWIDAGQVNPTTPFTIEARDGRRITGLITAPRHPHLKPIPMVVLCPDLPWQRVRSDYSAEVQALADMGFVVVQVNSRGAWGIGLRQRQSLTTGYDEVQIEDIMTATSGLTGKFAVNAGRIALLGRGHGGFIALRTLQTHPGMFRCAIALDAHVNLGDWLAEQRWNGGDVQAQLERQWFGDADRLKAAPLAGSPAGITKPVLMLNYPGPLGGQRRAAYSAARDFAGRVRGHGAAVEFGELTTDYMNGLPVARADVFDRIEAFLNTHLYDFTVKVHETQIAK